MVATGAFAGVYKVDWVLARPVVARPTLGEELKRIGYAGDAPVGGRPVDAYFEFHIEQGPILDEKKILIGICTGAMSATGILFEFKGETAHTGPWPMEKRKNALLAGARLLDAVDKIGWDHASGGMAIVLNAFGDNFMQLGAEQGIDPALMHRVTTISAGTLDALPHNGTVLLLLKISGLTHRESYFDMVMTVIVSVIIALVAVLVLGSMFGSF
jgi:acetylornithine deacetylase/succinyl-diaminopimelate desuccinylase-like protein